jgi:hypothetical protein
LSANTGAGLTYQWKKGAANIAGATSANYNAKGAGAYKVVVTNSNGCTKTSNTISVTIIICKDGEAVNNQMEYTVSPNPFGTATQLQLANVNEDVQLSIYDITGKMVYTYKH